MYWIVVILFAGACIFLARSFPALHPWFPELGLHEDEGRASLTEGQRNHKDAGNV